jgi:hypothetical protein
MRRTALSQHPSREDRSARPDGRPRSTLEQLGRHGVGLLAARAAGTRARTTTTGASQTTGLRSGALRRVVHGGLSLGRSCPAICGPLGPDQSCIKDENGEADSGAGGDAGSASDVADCTNHNYGECGTSGGNGLPCYPGLACTQINSSGTERCTIGCKTDSDCSIGSLAGTSSCASSAFGCHCLMSTCN